MNKTIYSSIREIMVIRWLCFLLLATTLFVAVFFKWGYGQNTLDVNEQLEIRDQFNLGINLYYQKSYTLATSYFLEVLKKDSEYFFARYYLSLSFFHRGQTDEAIREMENLIRLHGLNRNLEQKINFFSQQKFLEIQQQNFDRYVWIHDYPNPEVQKISLENTLGNLLNPFSLLRKEGYRVRTPIEIKINNNNELQVLDFSLKKISHLDGDGVLLDYLYPKLALELNQEELSGPWDFLSVPDSVDGGENFWIADFLKDDIKVIDSQGRITKVFGKKGIGESDFLGIKGLTIDENNNVYVVDSGNGRIQFLNQRGEWLKSIGHRGIGTGALLNPIDAIYHQGQQQLFVLDKAYKKIVVFTSEGDFVNEFPIEGPGSPFPTQSSYPQKLYWDRQENPNYLYLLESKSLHRLDLSNLSWKEVELSRPEKPQQFISMARGEDGYLYLGNPLREKIEVLAPVEKTYVNLPVLVKSFDIQKFPIVKLEVSVKDLTGRPVKNLRSRNFSLYENRVALPFKLLPLPTSKRIILLVETSTATEEREFTVKAFMEELYDQLKDQDGVKVITYNRNGHVEETPFARLKLAAIEKVLTPLDTFTSSFSANTALEAAINYAKDPRMKTAVVMLTFTPHQSVHFQNRYIDIVQAFKNNDVPVYVFYAGHLQQDQSVFFHLHNLSRQTRGKFYTYDQGVLSRFENDFGKYQNGNYTLEYITTYDARNSGVFRRVAVDVRSKNSQGEDSLAGYPIP